MSFQAVAKSTNSASLVIGEISAREAEFAAENHPLVDGKGLVIIYLANTNECC
jgi:hypothetical protein